MATDKIISLEPTTVQVKSLELKNSLEKWSLYPSGRKFKGPRVFAFVDDANGTEHKVVIRNTKVFYVDSDCVELRKPEDFVDEFKKHSKTGKVFASISNLDNQFEKQVLLMWAGSESLHDRLDPSLLDYKTERIYLAAAQPTKMNIAAKLLDGKAKFSQTRFQLAVAESTQGKICFSKGSFYVDGVLYKPTKETAQHLGSSLFCDVCPIPRYVAEDDPFVKDCSFLATLAWIGKKPARPSFEKCAKAVRETSYGPISMLFKDDRGVATSGLIQPKSGKTAHCHNQNIRVWFDRANAFLFDACLKNIDLALIFGGNIIVSFEDDEQTPVPKQVLNMLKAHYGEDAYNSYTFVRAKWISHNKLFPEYLGIDDSAFFLNQKTKNSLSWSQYDLGRFLKLMSVNEFNEITGIVPEHEQEQKQENKLSEGELERMNLTGGSGKMHLVHTAKIIELVKPKIVGGRTDSAIMEITSKHWKKMHVVVNKKDVFIHGLCLNGANLIDFFHKDEEFSITLQHQSLDSTKKMQIVDQIVNMNKSPEEVSRNNRNIPLIFIFQWLKEAGGHTRIKVQGHSVDIIVKRAWIGNDKVKTEPGDPEIEAYLLKHSIPSYDQLLNVVHGNKNRVTPYYPVNEKDPSKIVNAVIHSIYPPTPKSANHFGLLKDVATGGPKKGIIAFEPDDLYLFYQNMGHCKDMSQILLAGEQVRCEIRPPLPSEVKRWTDVLSGCCNHNGKPLNLKVRYVCTLVYIGNRPNPPRSLKFDITRQEVVKNTALNAWLIERGITIDDFIAAVSGNPMAKIQEEKLPIKMSQRLGPEPKRSLPAFHQRLEEQYIEPFEQPQQRPQEQYQQFQIQNSETRNPIPIAPSKVSEILDVAAGLRSGHQEMQGCDAIMSKANVITRRIMSCISPNDPKVDMVVLNHEELELAMFMSKTLVSSIMSFTKREQSNKGPYEERNRSTTGINEERNRPPIGIYEDRNKASTARYDERNILSKDTGHRFSNEIYEEKMKPSKDMLEKGRRFSNEIYEEKMKPSKDVYEDNDRQRGYDSLLFARPSATDDYLISKSTKDLDVRSRDLRESHFSSIAREPLVPLPPAPPIVSRPREHEDRPRDFEMPTRYPKDELVSKRSLSPRPSSGRHDLPNFDLAKPHLKREGDDYELLKRIRSGSFSNDQLTPTASARHDIRSSMVDPFLSGSSLSLARPVEALKEKNRFAQFPEDEDMRMSLMSRDDKERRYHDPILKSEMSSNATALSKRILSPVRSYEGDLRATIPRREDRESLSYSRGEPKAARFSPPTIASTRGFPIIGEKRGPSEHDIYEAASKQKRYDAPRFDY